MSNPHQGGGKSGKSYMGRATPFPGFTCAACPDLGYIQDAKDYERHIQEEHPETWAKWVEEGKR
jgi:hypothetical protein